MQIYHTLIFFEENKGEIFTCDTIYFEDKYWLVDTWLELPNKAGRRPERIVCLENLKHQKMNWPGVNFSLSVPLPKSVFDPQIRPQTFPGYLVVDLPDIVWKTEYS